MTAPEFAILVHAKPAGHGQWIAVCPAHDDKNPSLSLSMGSNDRILLKCHAGCTANAIVAALGLTMRDLMPAPEPSEVQTFSYRDQTGFLQLTTHRLRKPGRAKMIWQTGPHGEKKLPDTLKQEASRPLYRLPELLKSEGAILLVEGEPHVDRLWTLDIPATTTSQGAGKARFTDLTPLVGRTVVLAPDNDDAGCCHMQDIAQRLIDLGQQSERIHWLEFPDLPRKGDILDWLGAGHSADEVKGLINTAPLFRDIVGNLKALSGTCLQNSQSSPGNGSSNLEDIEDIKSRDKEWATPIPFEENVGPEFPVATLPDWVRKWVEAESISTQTPPDLAGCLLLGMMATCLANAVSITPRGGWIESVNLYLLIAANSGERKSAVYRDAVEPIEELEQQAVKNVQIPIAHALAEREVLQRKITDLQSKAVKDATKTSDMLKAVDELQDCVVPSSPRFIIDDSTVEKLVSLLASQRAQRIACLSPEGGIFSVLAGRYSHDTPHFDALLKGFSNEPLRVDRINRAPDYVAHPAITLCLAVQPSIIQDLNATPAFAGRGLLARMLYSIPKSLVGHREISPPEMPEDISQTYRNRIKALFTWGQAQAEQEPRLLQLDDDAKRILLQFQTAVEPRLTLDSGDLSGMHGWANKVVGVTLRLAALLHMAGEPSLLTATDRKVCGTTMASSVTLAKYFIAHAQAAFGLMGDDPETQRARAILQWLRQNQPLRSISKQEAFQRLRKRNLFKKAADLDRPLELLIDHAYLRAMPAPASQRGRPGSPRYEINPCLNILNIPKNTPNSSMVSDLDVNAKGPFIPQKSINPALNSFSHTEEVQINGARF